MSGHSTPVSNPLDILAMLTQLSAQHQQQQSTFQEFLLQQQASIHRLETERNHPVPTKGPKLPMPLPFSPGDRPEDFVARIEHFFLFAQGYDSDGAKCFLFLSLLTSGHCADWAADLREKASPLLNDFTGLCKAFLGINPDGRARQEKAKEALAKLRKLPTQTFVAFWQDYQKLAREAQTPEEVIVYNLPESLDPALKSRYLSEANRPSSLSDLIELLIRLDQGIFAASGAHIPVPDPVPQPVPVPMDLGQVLTAINNLTLAMRQGNRGRRNRLSQEERDRRRANNLCPICADPNHNRDECPLRRDRHQGNDRG
jgi:hypothetical protein